MPAKYPNFFVVGAPKSGTSSLYAYLGQHPDFFISKRKEAHFFTYPEITQAYYRRSYVTSEEEYLGLYQNWDQEAYAGDFSPSYLLSPKAAQRIHSVRPDARIVAILRDPVSRAISHYLMDRRLGYQKKDLAEVLADPASNQAFHREYIQVGSYCNQVATYRDLFGDQVLVLFYEDLKGNPAAFLNDIFTFLDIDKGAAIDYSTVHGRYRMPRFPRLEKWRQTSAWNGLRRMIPQNLKNRLKPVLDEVEKPDFSAEEKTLRAMFAEDVDRLALLLGRDLSFWQPNHG